MSVAASLLGDDDVRPLLLLGRQEQTCDVEIADALPARALLHDDVRRCLCLRDDDFVVGA